MKVARVFEGSAADRAGVRTGDDLVAIAGTRVGDSLDVAFALGWADEEEADFEFERGDAHVSLRLPARGLDELGLALEEDRYRSCPNRCVFCFVDQLPGGLRPSLSFKDEDYRLSFAFGNYITLTNLADEDYERIERQRLSPLYVSVHATEDRLRRKLLGNPAAPPVLERLRRLGRGGATLHTQIVVVPGVNDGPVLERTLDDLSALEFVASTAVVPVGLTAHRDGLPQVDPVGPELAAALIDAVEARQVELLRSRGSRVVFAVDELYLKAGRELPPYEDYEDFPQAENGVGLLRMFERTFTSRLPELRASVEALGRGSPERVTVTILTGVSAAPFLEGLAGENLAGAGPFEVRVVAVANTLLGRGVTVAGLLPGADLAEAASAAPADLTLIPAEALNADGLTIDDMGVADIAGASGARKVVASCDIIGALIDHLDAIAGQDRPGIGTSA